MHFMGVELPFSELMSKRELLAHLGNDPTDRQLSTIRDEYQSRFGCDFFWRYPISDGEHAGTIIIPVSEGFLSLPYNEVDEEDYEIYLPDDAVILDADTIEMLAQDFKSYADSLLHAMDEARLICLEN